MKHRNKIIPFKRRTGTLLFILIAGLTQVAYTRVTNAPPAFDPIPSQTIAEDSTSKTISITGVTAGLNETGQSVNFTAGSSNPTIVPNPIISGTRSKRALIFQPSPNANGDVTITVTATDNGNPTGTFSRSFGISVTSVNDAPVRISPVTIATVTTVTGSNFHSAGLSTLVYTPGPSNEATQSLTLTVTAIPPTTIGTIHPCQTCPPATTNIAYSITQMRSLLFKPAATGSGGTGQLTWTVRDNGTPPTSITNTLTVINTTAN